jgi:hypothetical protein
MAVEACGQAGQEDTGQGRGRRQQPSWFFRCGSADAWQRRPRNPGQHLGLRLPSAKAHRPPRAPSPQTRSRRVLPVRRRPLPLPDRWTRHLPDSPPLAEGQALRQQASPRQALRMRAVRIRPVRIPAPQHPRTSARLRRCGLPPVPCPPAARPRGLGCRPTTCSWTTAAGTVCASVATTAWWAYRTEAPRAAKPFLPRSEHCWIHREALLWGRTNRSFTTPLPVRA